MTAVDPLTARSAPSWGRRTTGAAAGSDSRDCILWRSAISLTGALLLGVPFAVAPPAFSQNNTASNAAAPAAGASSTAEPTKPAARESAKGGTAAMKAPTNAKAQGSYSLGVSMGEQLHRAGLTNDSIAAERLTQGLRDALSGKVTMSESDQNNIATLVKGVREHLADANHSAAQAFLLENGKKKDVVTTASGLQYHIVNAGSGPSPKSTDEVTVNYRGTLLDGTEFDSSYKRGQPASFPVNGVIPGWQEALVLMKPGAKWQLFIPPKLAYDTNAPPTIPPGSMLLFDVELIKVKAPSPPGATIAPKPGAAGRPRLPALRSRGAPASSLRVRAHWRAG